METFQKIKKYSFIMVIGAANIDIGGQPDKPLIYRDSNIGKVRLSLGGVGRNIAHNARLLGIEVKLLTALGDDIYAQKVISHCDDLGIDLTHTLLLENASTSTYLFLNNHSGDMELAINDMSIYSYITPEYLADKMDIINQAELVFVDTNIPEESILYLAENCFVPIISDPVSCAKASYLLPVLGKLHTICPNILEAEVLSGIPIKHDEDRKAAAQYLLKKGLKRIFITLGMQGVYCADNEQEYLLPCFPSNLVNATGAGDAFTASLAYSWFNELSLRDTGLVGLAAAATAIESAETINPELSIKELNKRIQALL